MAINVLEDPRAWSGWERDKDGVIDLSIGQPSNDLLPLELLNEGLRDLSTLCDNGEFDIRDVLQYGHNFGSIKANTALAKFLSEEYQVPVPVESLLFTNGSSSALELCCATFTNPGDTVIIENPTYFLAKGVFHDHKLNIVAVSTDDQGIVLEKLKDALRTNANAKLLYLVTTFNNPTSATLTLDRRRELAQLCTEYPDLTVICDDVYQLLHFGVSPPPVMPHFYDKAISIGSFSKILAPGLRLGWIHASPEIIVRLALRGYIVSGGGLNPFVSSIVYSLLINGKLNSHLTNVRRVLEGRQKALCEAIREYMPGECEVHANNGGYFVWIRAPNMNLTQMASEAVERYKVAYTPGTRCCSNGGEDYMRLSFAYYNEDQLREAIRRIAQILKKSAAL